jgi:prefoldin subunit 5
LRLRRAATQELHVATPHARGAAVPARSARMTQVLRDGVERLEQELAKLNRAIEALNPVAVNPAFLPGPAAAEIARLQEAIEKIAKQIEDAEGRIRILASGKTLAGP